MIGSTFFQRLQQIIYHPQSLPSILGAALPNSANFFIQFIAMRALFLVWLRMCIPHGGVWQNWAHFICCPPRLCSFCNTGARARRAGACGAPARPRAGRGRLLCADERCRRRTPFPPALPPRLPAPAPHSHNAPRADRDKSLTYGPRTPRYGFELGHVLLIYLLSLTFSVVAPLLLPFSVVWFVFAWVQWRHNLCYVYQRKYESGGLMWTYIFSRICVCLVIMQLFTFCVLAFKGAYVQGFLLVAFMPALTIKFHRSCTRRFGRGVENVPLELASRAPRGRVPPLVYIPPPLQEKSWGCGRAAARAPRAPRGRGCPSAAVCVRRVCARPCPVQPRTGLTGSPPAPRPAPRPRAQLVPGVVQDLGRLGHAHGGERGRRPRRARSLVRAARPLTRSGSAHAFAAPAPRAARSTSSPRASRMGPSPQPRRPRRRPRRATTTERREPRPPAKRHKPLIAPARSSSTPLRPALQACIRAARTLAASRPLEGRCSPPPRHCPPSPPPRRAPRLRAAPHPSHCDVGSATPHIETQRRDPHCPLPGMHPLLRSQRLQCAACRRQADDDSCAQRAPRPARARERPVQ